MCIVPVTILLLLSLLTLFFVSIVNFTGIIMNIGSMCVLLVVKSAHANVSNVVGTHSLARFGKRTVSSPDLGICWYNLGMPTPGLLTVRCPKQTGDCVPATWPRYSPA